MQDEKSLLQDVPKQKIFTSKRLMCALYGMKIFITTQNSAIIIITVSIVAVATGLFFRLSASQWLWILVGLGISWLAEIFNTAIEFACNAVTTEFHPFIRIAKDVGAAGVMFADFLLGIIFLFVFVLHVQP